VRAALKAAALSALLTATTMCAVAPSAASAAPNALHIGDAVTLADLYGYLSALPQPRDWVRVRSTTGDVATIVTTGFGAERVGGIRTLWIETRVDTQTVSGGNVMTSSFSSPPVISKTYIVGDAFGPFGTTYQVVATVAAIGDKAFRMNDRSTASPSLAPMGPPASFSLADGLPFPTRSGIVLVTEPKDMTAAGVAIHATHLVVSFPSVSAAGVGVPATVVEVWQSPDVPLGTVLSSGSMLGVSRANALIAWGHGDYRSAIAISLDDLRGRTGGG
jgi:hypothetical protein